MDDIIMKFCIGWKYDYVPRMYVFNSDDRFILDRVSAVNDDIMSLANKHFKGMKTCIVLGAISYVEYCSSQMLYGTREEKDPTKRVFDWDMFLGKEMPDWWAQTGVSGEVHDRLVCVAGYLMQRHPQLYIKLEWEDGTSTDKKCKLHVTISYTKPEMKTEYARVPSAHGDSARSRSSHREDGRSSFDYDKDTRSTDSSRKRFSDVSYNPDELSYPTDSERAASVYEDATSKFIPGGDLVGERVMQVLHQQMDNYVGEYAGEKLETIISKQADAAIKLQSSENDAKIQGMFAELKTSMEKKHLEMKKMCEGYGDKIGEFGYIIEVKFHNHETYLAEKEQNLDKSIREIQDQSRKNDAKIQKGIVDMQKSILSQTEMIEASLKAIEDESKMNDGKIEKGIAGMQQKIDASLKELDEKSKEIDKKSEGEIVKIKNSIKPQLLQMKSDLEAEIKNDLKAGDDNASFRKATEQKIASFTQFMNQYVSSKSNNEAASRNSTPLPSPALPQAVTTPSAPPQAVTTPSNGRGKKKK
jgi:hypothetical protein